MAIWRKDQTGARAFSGGKESWELAAVVAMACGYFTVDVDEEMVADEERSCYNCRYRRWTATSFTCQTNSSGLKNTERPSGRD